MFIRVRMSITQFTLNPRCNVQPFQTPKGDSKIMNETNIKTVNQLPSKENVKEFFMDNNKQLQLVILCEESEVFTIELVDGFSIHLANQFLRSLELTSDNSLPIYFESYTQYFQLIKACNILFTNLQK